MRTAWHNGKAQRIVIGHLRNAEGCAKSFVKPVRTLLFCLVLPVSMSVRLHEISYLLIVLCLV